jgi:hypothetical protein
MYGHASPLLDAYRRTVYTIYEQGRATRFVPDRRSVALERLLARHHVREAAYLSAFNPESKPTSRAANRRAQRRLIDLLVRRGYRVLRGVGTAKDGGWKEEGVLAIGLPRRPAARIGRAFRQNAMLTCVAGRPAAVAALR